METRGDKKKQEEEEEEKASSQAIYHAINHVHLT